MCGIAGFVTQQPVAGSDELVAIARSMGHAIGHRGPDADDVWVDDGAGVAFSHRRLAVIDLSDDGRQPMLSPSHRYRITFNGEIYNYRELREELKGLGIRFRSQSDTEVLLGAIDLWGVEKALQRAVGMFAFALWDAAEHRLVLARDRFGEKPLYYGWTTWHGTPTFLFGSELSALKQHPAFAPTVDRGALALYLRHAYIPAPYSIYRGVLKVPPASYLVVDPERGPVDPVPEQYWSAIEVAESARPDSTREMDEVVDELDVMLRSIVRSRVVAADVPVGAFLSGGIDSSTIVALMQAEMSTPVRTFSIGFRESEYDEAHHAADVAAHLGTDHSELYVTPDETRDVIPNLPSLYSEPFADSSQIPTFLVSQLARRHVTVALSGDGGDEIFGGYLRYRVLQNLWRKLDRIPVRARRGASRVIDALPAAATDRVLGSKRLTRVLPDAGRRNPGAKLRKLSTIIAEPTAEAAYRRLTSIFPDPTSNLVPDATEPPTGLSTLRPRLELPAQRAMALDTISYLPDDILVKVDRAAMAVALETRVPFLDPDLLAFVWSLPNDMRIGPSGGKVVLRELLARYVPPALTERPKMGFGVPLADWLRGPLRPWAEDLIASSTWLDRAELRRVWDAHQSGREDASHQLWTVLVASQWSAATGDRLDG
jgi:asparagine synthase (glutamine-hydrolysing)